MLNGLFIAIHDYIYYIEYSISNIMYNQYMMTIGMCISTIFWILLYCVTIRFKSPITLWGLIIFSFLYVTTGIFQLFVFLWFSILLIVLGIIILLFGLKLFLFSKQKSGVYNSKIHITLYDFQQLAKKHNYIVEFDKQYKEYSLIHMVKKPYRNESESIILISAIPYESCFNQNYITKSYFNQYIQPYLK